MSTATRLQDSNHTEYENTDSRSAAVWGDGHGLTEKQAAFAQHVADGLNHSAAYRQAYDTVEMAQNTVWREAHRLSRNEKVAARIAQLVAVREEEERARAASRANRVIGMIEAIMDTGQTDSVRLRAAELLGKTVGLFVGAEESSSTSKTVAELEQELADLLNRRS